MLRLPDPCVVILVGPSASGKSTWAAEWFPPGRVAFADAECRARNRRRPRPVPAKVLAGQLRRWAEVRDELAGDGFDAVHPAGPVRVVHPELVTAPGAAARQQEEPMPLSFGLQIATFNWPDGIGPRLASVARAAEDAGFTSLWVMDHFVQIPQVGRHWEPMLDSWTTLGFLAGHTRRATLGTMVTGITYRNVAHLAKIVATLDVLSGGRALCGLGAGWFEREHTAYGFDFPPARERLDLLEDALQVLPLMWGPGAPSFEGKVLTVPEAICYPRPIQDHVPILVGGSGEKRTLRLVARYADACNLFGDEADIRHKLDVLRAHCADVGRDPAEIEVTHLSTVLDATVEEQVGRYRTWAEAGVQSALVRFSVLDEKAIEAFAPVIAAFGG